VFPKKDQAIGYAETRACFRTGEIRILDLTGKLERTILFNKQIKCCDVPPDARPSSKLECRAGRKHVLPSSFYVNGRTKFSKRLNREHARQPCLEQKQTDANSFTCATYEV
jgi:hypothetical protein